MILDFFKHLALAGVLLVIAFPASAQRTMRGQYFFGADYLGCVAGDSGMGGSVTFGQYLEHSRYDAGVVYMKKQTDEEQVYSPILAYGDWMYRLASSSTHGFNLYAGLFATMGYEAAPAREVAAEGGEVPHEETAAPASYSDPYAVPGFMMGAGARMDAEIFLGRSVALAFGVSAPLNFLSSNELASVNVHAGLRINL